MAEFADTTVAAALGGELVETAAAPLVALPGALAPGAANLYAVGDLIAARAARPSTRKQYAGIYRRFADALRAELGRPPTVADLTADAIAGYARALERSGGRGGGPASLATRRVHLTMLRALAAELGLERVAVAVRLPAHKPGPPETLTAVEYDNLVRVPDRRTIAGRRDHAMLRVLDDTGVRSAELRSLTARAIRRPRQNSRHHHLYVHGKGGNARSRSPPTPTPRSRAGLARTPWPAAAPGYARTSRCSSVSAPTGARSRARYRTPRCTSSSHATPPPPASPNGCATPTCSAASEPRRSRSTRTACSPAFGQSIPAPLALLARSDV